MFPSSRNSFRRWSEHGNKVPVPIAVTLHNVMAVENLPSHDNNSNHKKWFRPEHQTSLLPNLQLDVVVQGDRIVYSSSTSNNSTEQLKSVHPTWEHLDERIDLPGEWWLDEKGRGNGEEEDVSVYQSMKLRFTLLKTKRKSDMNIDIDIDIDNDNEEETSSSVFLEVPIYPSKLERLNVIPEALPHNACLVYFSDGSTRLPTNLFQVLLDSQLVIEPPPVEDFSRFEDDVFRTLDDVPDTPARERAMSTSALLLGPEDAQTLFSEKSNDPTTPVEVVAIVEPTPVSFDDSEQDVLHQDLQMERASLEALIAQEQAEVELELASLEEQRNSLSDLITEAKTIENDNRLVQGEIKLQAADLTQEDFLRDSQCVKLLKELQTIYPITMDSQKGYLIRSQRLPVDIYTTMVPEDEISAALGFCSHLVFLLSKYLSVNLRHRLFCNSSRSAIQQDGGTTFVYPLFSARVVEREQLDRGLTLLGQNVDSILMTYDIEYTPRSHMLARLKRIYDHFIDGTAPLLQ